MLKGVLFDLDGVIIDTERHGHRVAFNQAFAELGYPDIEWGESFYQQLLGVGGGKERCQYYFAHYYQGANPPADLPGFIKKMHQRKTDLFLNLLPTLPLRPGVLRFMREARDQGMVLGICTTTNERVADAVAHGPLAEIQFRLILAGDAVKKKKPDPEIYLTALERLGLSPDETLVVEDSHIGVQAAKAAGCRVLATYNGYTEGEDLSAADDIVSCLGDPNGVRAVVRKGGGGLTAEGVVHFRNCSHG